MFNYVNTRYMKTVHKFGRAVVGTTFTPVCWGGVYIALQPANATTLRIKAGGDVLDTAAGAGARKVTIQGINAVGAEVTEVLTTAGASASAVSSNTYIRLYRAYVSESGRYGTVAAGGHEDDIVIENGAGGTDWMTIDATGFARSQSELAAYCVPAGFTAYISYIKVHTDATKVTDILLFKRENVLDAAAPYEAPRMQLALGALAGASTIFNPNEPYGPFEAGTDLTWVAKVGTGTGEVVVDFEILLTKL